MKKPPKYIKYIIIVFLITITIFGCNPVKQVLKDNEKFEKVAQEVVRRGYCVNDTVVVTKVKDSIIERPVEVVKVLNVPCKDFDTTIKGSRIAVSSGVLTFTPKKDSIIVRETVRTETVRDRKYEDILKGDISNLEKSVISKDKEVIQKDKDIATFKAENKTLKADAFKAKLKLYGIILLSGLIIFRKPLIRLIGL